MARGVAMGQFNLDDHDIDVPMTTMFRMEEPLVSVFDHSPPGNCSVEFKLESSFRTDRMVDRVAQMISDSPGKTSHELAAIYHFADPGKIWRRLNECEKLGKIIRGEARKCGVGKGVAFTWFPKKSS